LLLSLDKKSPLCSYAVRFVIAAGPWLSVADENLRRQVEDLAYDALYSAGVMHVKYGLALDVNPIMNTLYGYLEKPDWQDRMSSCCRFITRLCASNNEEKGKEDESKISLGLQDYLCQKGIGLVEHYGTQSIRMAIRVRGKAKEGPEQEYVDILSSKDASEDSSSGEVIDKLVDSWKSKFINAVQGCFQENRSTRIRKAALTVVVALEQLD